MRYGTALLFLAMTAIPALAAKRVTLKQLNQSLTEAIASSKSEKDILHILSQVELTERMSIEDLQQWQAKLPGSSSRQALTVLADSSSFLKPPAEQIPSNPPLDKDAQHKLLASALDYVDKTLAKLPNFFATESITLFEDTPAGSQYGGSAVAYRPIHYDSQTNATVLYREGKEVMETKAGQITEDDQLVSATSGLLSSGQFGPVLKTVLTDAQKGKLTWSRWESSPESSPQSSPAQKAGGVSSIAVFSYAVPRKESHYRVKVELGDESKPRQSRPGYQGEIAINAADGTILRLTLKAEKTDDDSFNKADMMIEYANVEIGGKSYLCPVRSVAIVNVDQQAESVSSSLTQTLGRGAPPMDHREKDGSRQTMLNDITFHHYHLLRSDARILTPADTNDDGTNPR
jgi:hypothetical protein